MVHYYSENYVIYSERDWNIFIPGYPTTDRALKRPFVLQAHKQRLAIAKKQIKRTWTVAKHCGIPIYMNATCAALNTVQKNLPSDQLFL